MVVTELRFQLLGVNSACICDAYKRLRLEIHTNAIRWWLILFHNRHKRRLRITLEFNQHLLILPPQELQVPIILRFVILSRHSALLLTHVTALELRLPHLAALHNGFELITQCKFRLMWVDLRVHSWLANWRTQLVWVQPWASYGRLVLRLHHTVVNNRFWGCNNWLLYHRLRLSHIWLSNALVLALN